MAAYGKSQPTKYVLDRNNTSFTLQLFEYFKNLKWGHEYDFLKYYQNLVRSYISDVNVQSRGILASLEMGLGKSILAVSIAVDLIKERQPIILLTKSLQENMRGAIKKYVRLRADYESEYHLGRLNDLELTHWIDHNFSFVSMNASNMLKQMGKATEGHTVDEFDAALDKKFGEVLKLASLDGKLLIVDEAHNLFRAITNGSKNAIGLYDLVMKAKNLKIVFLTGTPIANDPFELVSCFNMLAGALVLPESYKEFNKLFVDGKNGRIKNKEKFQNRLLGLVSHVSNRSEPGKAFGVDDIRRAEFPTELPTVVERVNMDDAQFVVYQLARDKEQEEGGRGKGAFGSASARPAAEPPSMTKPKSGAASTYRVKSRQLSNFCAPHGLLEEKDPANIPAGSLGSAKYRRMVANIDKHSGQLGIVYSQFVGVGGLGTLSRYLDTLGWVRREIGVGKSAPVEENDIYVGMGPEIPSAMDYLQDIEREAVGSKWWRGGDESVSADDADDANDATPSFDINSLLADEPSSQVLLSSGRVGGAPLVYAIISGEVKTEDRQRIQDEFNAEDNKHGGQIDLILLSSTGAEGLDLKNVRHIHVTEPYWNWGRVKQIIARGVRNDSHKTLPADEKNVTPYIYLAIPPESDRGADGTYKPTTDTELFDEAVKEQLVIESFHEALHEIAIECMANGESYCRTCNPSGERLFTDDVARDVAAPDPCSAMREEQVRAEEIIVDGVTYYFKPDDTRLYDYAVYEHDKNIDGYRPMKESNPLYAKIVEAIEAAVIEPSKIVKSAHTDAAITVLEPAAIGEVSAPLVNDVGAPSVNDVGVVDAADK